MSRTWRLRGYAIECLLGAGASSEVWRARVARTGETVALKRITLNSAGHLDRATAEAAVLSVLDHPNLVRLHDLVPDDGAAVLVLDLADGGSIADLLSVRGRLAPGEVITAVAPVAAALSYVHGQGVVHGDVSAANVLFTSGGVSLLADLGVARLTGDERDAESTPAYVDPCVAAGGVPGPASDVFMLAAVAFHALTGAPPWAASSAEQALAAARAGELDDVADRLAQARVPGPVTAALVRALVADPQHRCTAADLALDLRHSGTPVAVELNAGLPRRPPVARTDLTSHDSADGNADGNADGYAAVPEYEQTAPRAVWRRVGTGVDGGGVGRGGVDGGGVGRGGVGRGGVGRAGTATPRRAVTAIREAASAGRADGVRRAPDSTAGLAAGGLVATGQPGSARRVGRHAAIVGAPPPTRAVRRPRPTLPSRATGPRRRVLLTVAAAVVVAAVTLGLVHWLGTSAPAAQAARRPSTVPHPVASATSGSPTAPAASSGSTAPGRRSSAAGRPQDVWSTGLRQADAVRAKAFATRDATLLGQVYEPGPLLRADTALLRRIVPPGCGLVGATTSYTALHVRAADARHATVTTRASLPRTSLRCPGRPSRQAAGVGPANLTIGLVRTGSGIRISTQYVERT